MALTIDSTSWPLPADEFQPQKVVRYNGLLNALQAVWASWNPTWTNLTVGNGAVTARYRQVGRLVVARLHLIFGSTTSVSGSVSFSLPITAASYAGTASTTSLGLCRLYDASVPVGLDGAVMNASTTTGLLTVFDSSGTYLKAVVLSSTVPFTWTTSDEIHSEIVYESA